jgi:hypothetical protein
MDDDLRPRVGNFFIVIGVVLLVLFIGSDMAKQVNFYYFFYSVCCLGIGTYLRLVSSKEKGTSQRFGAIRKHREKRRQEKEAKKKAKQEKSKQEQSKQAK